MEPLVGFLGPRQWLRRPRHRGAAARGGPRRTAAREAVPSHDADRGSGLNRGASDSELGGSRTGGEGFGRGVGQHGASTVTI